MGILPVKLRMLQFISQNQNISNDNLYYALTKEYPKDKYVSQKGIDECLLSLKSGGLIETTGARIGNFGKLIQSYKITSYGTDKMKYINQ